MMNRTQALEYVGHAVDDAGAVRTGEPIPDHARLVVWQCGFEPMVVAVWSYLPPVIVAQSYRPEVALDDDEAEYIATDYLREIGWFANDPCEPDYII